MVNKDFKIFYLVNNLVHLHITRIFFGCVANRAAISCNAIHLVNAIAALIHHCIARVGNRLASVLVRCRTSGHTPSALIAHVLVGVDSELFSQTQTTTVSVGINVVHICLI